MLFYVCIHILNRCFAFLGNVSVENMLLKSIKESRELLVSTVRRKLNCGNTVVHLQIKRMQNIPCWKREDV